MRALGFLLVVVAAHAAAAAAPISDDDLSARVTELNRSALVQIDAKKFDAARRYLRDAERIARARGGFLGEAWLARTQLHLGALEIVGGDPAQAKEQFRRALCRVPNIRIGGPIGMRAEVVRAFGEMRAVFRPPPRCPVARSERDPELPARIRALDCPSPEVVLGGTDLVVRCVANPRLGVVAVTLHYDPDHSYEYKRVVEMKRSAGGWWTATVPARDITESAFAHYFEGLNARGHHIVSSGSRDGPRYTEVVAPDLCRCD